ncbi:MAG: hypothetical protein J5895_04725 [Alphaproteobacteria bacterium]|nr:hypothetical protein [Alphaproteobacteria bacterium]
MKQIINWNYQRSAFAPDAHKQNVKRLVQAAINALNKDMDEQNVLQLDELEEAEEFSAFCEANKEAIESFGRFLKDFQGAHDRDRYLYQWPQIQEFSCAVFKFNIRFEGRVRLLDITSKSYALMALDDEEVCRYILMHFEEYFEGEEDVFGFQEKLYRIWSERVVSLGSAPWCLYELCKSYYFYLNFDEIRYE